jgi:hypothetical protein
MIIQHFKWGIFTQQIYKHTQNIIQFAPSRGIYLQLKIIRYNFTLKVLFKNLRTVAALSILFVVVDSWHQYHVGIKHQFSDKAPIFNLKIGYFNNFSEKRKPVKMYMTHFKCQVGLWMRTLCYRGIFSASISRFFSGLPLNFQDISGIALGGWVISFLSPEFCTPAGRGTLFRAGERKIPGWARCKIFR